MTNVPEHLRLCDEQASNQIADRIVLSLAERVVGYLWTREQWGGDVPFDGVMEQIHRQVLRLMEWEAPDAERRDRGAIIPAGVRRSVYERDDYRCVFCGEQGDITIDHITARANGGTDDVENLQTLCRPCNSRKGAHQ